jgi:hypothetical protein
MLDGRIDRTHGDRRVGCWTDALTESMVQHEPCTPSSLSAPELYGEPVPPGTIKLPPSDDRAIRVTAKAAIPVDFALDGEFGFFPLLSLQRVQAEFMVKPSGQRMDT